MPMNQTASIVALVLALLVGPPGRAVAQVSQVSVHVDGLGCPFCVYGIEKKLGEVPGVESVSTDLKSGQVSLELAEGATPDVRAIENAVTKAGFTPRQVTLTAIGTLLTEEDGVLLAVRGSDARYLLFEEGRDHKDFFSPETRAGLERKVEEGTLVAITGSLHEHAEGPVGLSIDKLEEVQVLSLKVEGMRCENCAARLERLLEKAPGVANATVDFSTGEAAIEASGEQLESSGIISVVEEAGFTATPSEEAPVAP